MYPYRDRLRWLAAGRYAHLARALESQGRAQEDAVLAARLASLRAWGHVRLGVVLLLTVGLAATAAAWIARYLPQFDTALDAVNQFTAFVGTLSGILTALYLFLNRLLGQLEIDILTLLVLEPE